MAPHKMQLCECVCVFLAMTVFVRLCMSVSVLCVWCLDDKNRHTGSHYWGEHPGTINGCQAVSPQITSLTTWTMSCSFRLLNITGHTLNPAGLQWVSGAAGHFAILWSFLTVQLLNNHCDVLICLWVPDLLLQGSTHNNKTDKNSERDLI